MSRTILEFNFIGYKPCSANDMYVPTVVKSKKKGRYKSFFRATTELKNWKAFIQSSFDQEYFYTKEEISEFKEYILNNRKGIKLVIEVSIPRDEYIGKRGNLSRHDTSNFIKAIEDGVLGGISIDDRYTTKLIARKGFNEDGVWGVKVRVSEYEIGTYLELDTRKAFINKKEE